MSNEELLSELKMISSGRSEENVPIIKEGLSSNNPATVHESLNVLGELASVNSYSDDIVRLCGHEDDFIACGACLLVKRIDNSEKHHDLIRLLKDVISSRREGPAVHAAILSVIGIESMSFLNRYLHNENVYPTLDKEMRDLVDYLSEELSQ
jgi:hypothetical protein